MEQKREFFRITYPVAEAAKIQLKPLGEFAVVNISQRGIKVLVPNAESNRAWKQGAVVSGFLKLLCGEILAITVSIFRVETDFVVLSPAQPLELKAMYDEHRYLIQKYGEFSK